MSKEGVLTIMKRTLLILTMFTAVLFGCSSDRPMYELYRSFPDKTWHRFNILQFEIPVKSNPNPFNVIFFARHTRDYLYDSLAFNMIMKTPAGEEMIREVHVRVKNSQGAFIGTFAGDSCEITTYLKKDMIINKDGKLVIELENLIPRMENPGLCGVGIRLEKP